MSTDFYGSGVAGGLWEKLSELEEDQPLVFGCSDPTSVRSLSNHEREGRRDMTVSGFARRIGADHTVTRNVRHVDSDLRQTCAKCCRPYILIEDSAQEHGKSITYTSVIAHDLPYTCYSMKLIHHGWDVDHQQPIKEMKLIENGTHVVQHRYGMSWDELEDLMTALAIAHETFECPGHRASGLVTN